MVDEMYKTLGLAKCEELAKKSWGIWALLDLGNTRKSSQVLGVVIEGITKDFIRGFLPTELKLKSGLIFDNEKREVSPQIDAIIYKGVPLLDYMDTAVVEKGQVKAILEIKSVITQRDIFGSKRVSTDRRNPESGLYTQFSRIKQFLPRNAASILFTFELHSATSDRDVIRRLGEICDRFAVVIRREPVIERKIGKPDRVTDFDDSVSGLIEWLRNIT